MFLKPCYNCPHKKGCEIKAAKQSALRGLGVTSVNFRCDKRLSLLPPGQRISLTLKTSTISYAGEYPEPVLDDFDTEATVMRASRNRILVWLDELSSLKRNPIRVRPDRVTPLAERVSVCFECGQPEGTKPRKEWSKCWKCEGYDCFEDCWNG